MFTEARMNAAVMTKNRCEFVHNIRLCSSCSLARSQASPRFYFAAVEIFLMTQTELAKSLQEHGSANLVPCPMPLAAHFLFIATSSNK